MKPPKSRILCFSFGVLSLGLSLSACTPGCTREARDTPPPPAPKSRFLFNFDYTRVDRAIVSHSPDATRTWIVRLNHESGVIGWRIEAARTQDGEIPLLDRYANGTLIEHLLDSVRTLRVIGTATPASQASVGLAPPKYTISWTAQGNDFAILLGDVKPDGSIYAVITQQGAGKGSPQVLLLHGAVTGMLKQLTSFRALRLNRLVPVETDEVDEVQVSTANGKRMLYAERAGTTWVDQNQKPLSEPIEKRLDALIHAPARYLDHPQTTRLLLQKISKNEFGHIQLIGRLSGETRIAIGRERNRYWCTVSTRPEAVFELSPELVASMGLLR